MVTPVAVLQADAVVSGQARQAYSVAAHVFPVHKTQPVLVRILPGKHDRAFNPVAASHVAAPTARQLAHVLELVGY